LTNPQRELLYLQSGCNRKPLTGKEMRYDRIYIGPGCAVHIFLPLHECGRQGRVLQTLKIKPIKNSALYFCRRSDSGRLFCFMAEQKAAEKSELGRLSGSLASHEETRDTAQQRIWTF
jgi:hypothetical protein